MGEIADALKRASAEREASIAEKAEQPSSPDVDPGAQSPAPEAVRQHSLSHERSEEVARSVSVEKPLDPPFIPPIPPIPPLTPPLTPTTEDGTETSEDLSNLEHNRHLALRLRTELENHSARSLAIVSALRNEGKTTVACNIAIALASLMPERSVAIVDLDLRNPSVDRQL
jgi:Mrp family chromosome partitioning ATPase